MDLKYSINKLTEQDINSVIELETRVLNESLGYDLLSDSLNNSSYDFRCLKTDNKLIGYISTAFTLDFGDIYNFVIEPEYQRIGLGTVLLNSILNEHPNCEITLEVRKSNLKAINFYLKNNFTQVGERKEYYADKEDALIMLRKN